MGHLALSNSETLQVVGSVALLLLFAHLLGSLARRAGQPSVVGYLVAGLLLGPSGLGAAWPALGTFVLPSHGRSQLLGAIVEFSLLMVLISLGAETDVPLVRRLGQRALGVITGSILLPLVAGSAVAYAFGASLVVGNRLVGAVLIGGALGVSSLPVIARLVQELRIARRDVGQLALATAAANDVYGLVLLAVLSALVSAGGPSGLLPTIGGLLAFVALFAFFGQRCADFFLRKVRHGGPNTTASIAVAVVMALGVAAAVQAFGIEAALGAFFVGVVIGRSRFQHSETLARLRSFSDAVFAPLYFASAGLLINLKDLSSWHQAAVVSMLFVTAVLSKAVGAGIAGRWAGLRRREDAALVTLLNGRGALQVIMATAGLRLGLLSGAAYTSVLVVSIVTSVLIAPTLRRLVGHWEGSDDEQRRLAYEQRIESSLLVREQRLLVPVLADTNADLAVALFDRAWPDAAELTVLSSAPGVESEAPSAARRPVRRRTVTSPDVVNATLEEARLGYGVLGIGVPPTAPGLPSHAAELLSASPLPTVVVRPGSERHDGIGAPDRIVVATTGTVAAIAGEELASSLAYRHRSRLHIVHVVPEEGMAVRQGPVGPVEAPDGVLDEALGRARKAGVRPRVVRERAISVSSGLLQYVETHGVDLLVVGARPRPVLGAPFLGYTVEELLRSSLRKTALAIVVFPDTPPADLDQPYVEHQPSRAGQVE